MNTNKVKIIFILGPSGVGKTTLVKKLIETQSFLKFIPSYTTRMPRNLEKDGIDYNFISNEKFESLIKNDFFIEYDKPYQDKLYGLSKNEIETANRNGFIVIRTIAPEGLRQIQKAYHKREYLTIKLLPSSNFDLFKIVKERDGFVREELLYSELEKIEVDFTVYSIYQEPDLAFQELQKIIKSNIIG